MTIAVHLGPGETISQALNRVALIARETKPITIPPGVHIVERRTTGIPFLNYSGDQP